MKRTYKCLNGGSINGINRLPIESLSIDFDVPLELANCLVGEDEKQTENRIALFKGYLKDLLAKKRMWERFDFIPKVWV